MDRPEQLQAVIDRAIAWLEVAQQPSGSFISYSSPAASEGLVVKPEQTVFGAAVILRSLLGVEGSGADGVRQRLVEYLATQQSVTGSFNYWDRTSPKNKDHPYPDDLDDTAIALRGMWGHDASLRTGAALAQFASLLIAAERQTGGPYRTWLIDGDAAEAWQDIDMVVNAAVGDVLTSVGVTLPSLVALVESAITSDRLSSPYYPGWQMTVYAASRWYAGKLRPQLCRRIWEYQDSEGGWGSCLNTALAIASLLRLGEPVARLAPMISWLADQQYEGAWPAAPICIDPTEDGVVHYAGSSAMSTAVCTEALALYRSGLIDQLGAQSRLVAHDLSERVWSRVRERAATLPSEFRGEADQLLRRIQTIDRGQHISRLPAMVARSIGESIEESSLDKLALASMYGWMSYTLADDILDGDATAAALPLVMVTNRWMRQMFATVIRDKEYQRLVDHSLELMDAASVWELKYCRPKLHKKVMACNELPDFQQYLQLAHRSLGHMLGGVGVFVLAGHPVTSNAVTYFCNGMKHYIIARQLNDDAHDWQADLSRGHINSVGALLLRRWQQQEHTSFHIVTDMPAAQRVMWEQEIDGVLADIRFHIERSRSAFRKAFLGDIGPFGALLERIESAVQVAAQERRRTQGFIDNF
jgi:hypothetical protein